MFSQREENIQPSCSLVMHTCLREGIKKKSIFLGNSPKQRTPPTHRSGNIDFFRSHSGNIDPKSSLKSAYFHISTSLGLLTPTHPQFRTFSQKNRFFYAFPKRSNRQVNEISVCTILIRMVALVIPVAQSHYVGTFCIFFLSIFIQQIH